MLEVVRGAKTKPENARREKALVQLLVPGAPFGDQHCRGLGDAVFALMATKSGAVLTTNGGDHGPLTAALGKRVEKL